MYSDRPVQFALISATINSPKDFASALLEVPRDCIQVIEFKGEPIVYAMTIPAAAPHRALPREFVRFVLSPAGRRILEQAGFRLPPRPAFTGAGPEVLK